MRERVSQPSRSERGVSLLELVVVVAVVGVLVALVVPTMLASVRSAREARALGNLRTIAAAEMQVYARERRFAVFEELFQLGAVAGQFEREIDGGGPRGTGSEAVSDGAYAFSIRFDREAVGITIDADPRPGYVGTHRWFRMRLGRIVRGASGGEMAVYVADPSPRPPPPNAYRPLGVR